ncbi:DUF4342 domain-containing protein [Clostridium sp. D2Q-11]|uniref:DUF4342 domain-containing protein n=1 Tax=Anaeromonas frigoriresistens TaxID=2683708 RepID=A0A942UPI6_9FIRM|nr:DUF4342 domain-containing protein [Anaeromonas frigoriresistens]MBS4536909.1 DUF4342 domain-containing protein [Anaeromonas frigoriresistens]
MDISLEKIDTIRERTGASYKEAKEILEKHNGDIVEALIDIENNDKGSNFNINQTSEEVISKLKEIVKKGNITKIILKKDGEVIMNIPVTAGAIGAVLAPQLSAIGIAAAMISRTTIEIVKEDGEVVNLNEMAGKTVDKIMRRNKDTSTSEYTEDYMNAEDYTKDNDDNKI